MHGTGQLFLALPLLSLLVVEPTALAQEARPSEAAKPKSEIQTKASFGKGVTIGTRDERFTLNVRARIQVQGLFASNPEDGDDPQTEALVRRMRLLLQGNAAGPKLTYYIQLGFSNRDTESDLRLPLRDAYVTWAAHRDLELRLGQMKVPFGRQRVNSSSALEMVDRSIVVGELNLDRDVGVQVFSKNLFDAKHKLGYAIGVFGGDGRNRTNERGGLLYVAQLQLRPFGEFDELVEGDLSRRTKPALLISIGGAYNQATNRSQSTIGSVYKLGGFDYAHASVATSFKWHGFSASGEAILRKASDDSVRGVPPGAKEPITEYARSARGLYVQVGQMLSQRFQLVGRFGELAPIGESDPALKRRRELGWGLNHYFEEHNLKLQTDYFYLFGSEFIGGVHQIRTQMQLYF